MYSLWRSHEGGTSKRSDLTSAKEECVSLEMLCCTLLYAVF